MNYPPRFIKVPLFIAIIGLILTGCLRPDISNIPAAPPKAAATDTAQVVEVPTVEPTDAPTELPAATATLEPKVPLLRYVPGSSFLMGSTDEDKTARPDESPQHLVRLPGFWIYTYEVTNGMYADCVASGKCSPPELAETGPKSYYGVEKYKDYPVVGVNWSQAETYCKEHEARLPTEAEWEKASRGELGKLYPWGDDKPVCDLSNFQDCLKDLNKTAQYETGESPFKVLDMSGNVREWVSDWYRQDYYALTPIYNPPGPEAGRLRVVRGGGYLDVLTDIRSASRFAYQPVKNFEDVGFRCVPLGVEHASYCQPSYKRSCDPPDTHTRKPCVPSETTDFGITIRVSCPKDGVGDMTILTGGTGPSVSVTVDGQPWDCVNDGVAGRYECKGPLPPAGTRVDVSICEGLIVSSIPTSQNVLAVGNCKSIDYSIPAGPDSIVNGSVLDSFLFAPALPMSIYCPDGYIWDSNLLACAKIPDDTPEISEESGKLCPQGYGFDVALGCCTPLPDSPCPPGQVPAVFTAALLATPNCVPIQPNGCEPGWIYDPYQGCIKPPEGASPNNDPWCPKGSHWESDNGCTPNTVPGVKCPDGSYFSSIQQKCVNYTDKQCPENTYLDPDTKKCLPLRGPNSGCPPNQMMNPRLGCCVPIPGTDGTDCPDGEAIPIDAVPSITHVTGAYDPGSGNCPPEQGNPCGVGWVPNPNGGCDKVTSCPDGTAPSTAAAGLCVPVDGSQNCPENWKYDKAQKACVLVGTVCQVGKYFDFNLGICVPLSENCCRLDQYIDPRTGKCLDNPTPDENQRCPNGWENIRGFCVQTTTDGSVLCNTESIVIPACDITCPKGYHWSNKTGLCEKDPPQNPCTKYTTYDSCKAALCTWVRVPTPGHCQ